MFDDLLAASGLAHLVAKPAGACLYACIIVAELLPRSVGVPVVVRGGDGVLDGGYRDAGGHPHGHYWCELRTASGQQWIVDITADQFDTDAAPTRVWLATNPETIARYQAGSWATVDAQVADFINDLSSRDSETLTP